MGAPELFDFLYPPFMTSDSDGVGFFSQVQLVVDKLFEFHYLADVVSVPSIELCSAMMADRTLRIGNRLGVTGHLMIRVVSVLRESWWHVSVLYTAELIGNPGQDYLFFHEANPR